MDILFLFIHYLPHRIYCVSVYILYSFALYIKEEDYFTPKSQSLHPLGGDVTL